VYNQLGALLFNDVYYTNNGKGTYVLDLSNRAKGTYYIKTITGTSIRVNTLVIQ
jgi:hypothetical protein